MLLMNTGKLDQAIEQFTDIVKVNLDLKQFSIIFFSTIHV